MTIKEKIKELETLKATIEWELPLEYQVVIDEVIADLNWMDNARLCSYCKNHTGYACKKWECNFERKE